MKPEKLKDDLYWVGVSDPELRVFDIIMETKRGTTYNSYLIQDEKIVLFDSVKNRFSDMFLENIKSVIGDKGIDYIVVHHTELDHSGSLEKVLDVYPNATIVASKAALKYLENILNRPFNKLVADKELNIGKRTLKFISAPNLHWPDTMFTYDEYDRTLFTCDVMGCHYCPTGCITGDCGGDYESEMKLYFDCIMGPFKKFVNMGLDKIEDLDLDLVAPSHGPIHTKRQIFKYIDLYRKWAEEEPIKEKNVQIFYISAYGNTEKIAFFMRDLINERGIKAEAHEITSHNLINLIDKVDKASGILVGSPTINQDAVAPAWNLLTGISAVVNKGKAAESFGSFGWSGEGVSMLHNRLKELKFKTLDNGFKFNFVPSEKEYEECKNFIDEYLKLIK